jgi:hypothetical protein
MLQAAAHDASHTQEFCGSVVTNGAPISVTCRPIPNQPENECFPIIEEYVAANGGEQIIGWAIWERPGVFIEAEFHSIWRSPDGENIDLVPRIFPLDYITFLPAPNRRYDGLQVDNVRKPLIKDNDLIRYLYLFRRKFEIMNSGDLAGQYGYIAIPKKFEREFAKLVKEASVLERRLAKRYPKATSAGG